LEAVNHLLDEEREDFRSRLQHLFSGSAQPWPPLAPQQWIIDLAYRQRSLPESMEKFLQERKGSLEWLRLREGSDFTVRYKHPPSEGLAAGDILFSWAAHDLPQLRQNIDFKWKY
jgi:hypothetical protein